MLTLDENHIYRIDGKELDGVTAVIKACGFMPSSDFIDPWYLGRGEAVHTALELYVLGTLDESTIDPRIAGFVESGKKYLADHPVKKEHIELKLHDPVYWYAGKIDTIHGDYKTGAKEKWHIYQVAAYRNLLKINKEPYEFMNETIYLQEDGNYPKIEPYTVQKLISAENTFKCMLNVYRARKEMGLP